MSMVRTLNHEELFHLFDNSRAESRFHVSFYHDIAKICIKLSMQVFIH